MKRFSPLAAAVCASLLVPCSPAAGADWPQHRYDAGRTAASPESLPTDLHLAWVREMATPRPAFPGEVRIRYDATYEPVVAGKTMFVPSMVTDSVTALDTDTGALRWQFFAEGPVRFAPAVWEGKVYLVSDDGYLYCLGADQGELLWKFRGLPGNRQDRKVLGNGRLISLVPARGGPVLSGGVVYFGAGIWSGEGVFVHALDAKTGKVIWSNTDSARIERANMDHGVAYYAGIAPQGYLAIVDDKLVVPCGAQLPAVLDPKTGKLASYTMGWGGRVGLPKGCCFVAGIRHYLIHGGDLYDIRTPNEERFRDSRGGRDFKSRLYLAGVTRLQIDRTNQKGLGNFRRPVLTPAAMYYDDQGIVASDLSRGDLEERASTGIPAQRRNDTYPDKTRIVFAELWRLDSPSRVHIKAAGRLYCARPKLVEAVEIPAPGEKPKIGWRADIQGTPHSMLAADGKLFVVTREGRIHAFGPTKPNEPVVHARPSAAPPEPDDWTTRTAAILKAGGKPDGYALVLGVGTGRLAEELVRQSRLQVIAVDADARKVDRLRRKFQQAGQYGTRVTVLVGDTASYPLPPYLASLVVSEDPGALGNDFARRFADALIYCLRPYGGTACFVLPDDKQREFLKAVSGSEMAGAKVREAGDFVLVTHEGALPDSADWSHGGADAANTGASRDRSVKPPLARLWFDGSFRWFRTPNSSVVRVTGGRLFIHADKLYAIDVYTGRLLWQTDTFTARPSDDRMVAVEDAVYLASGTTCARFDPATGRRTGKIDLPSPVAASWTHIRVAGDSLVGAAGPCVVCLNRRDGGLIWRHDRQRKVGCLALGGGKVFCADVAVKPQGKKPIPDVPIEALDASTGKVLWQTTGGSEVRYYEPLDMLCTSRGIFAGSDGARVRDTAVSLIAGDRLISGGAEQVAVIDPKTGARIGKELKWRRRGCTSLRASANLLTTRFMGNAACIDLATGQITSFWNVRAACSNNLFAADGVFNMPNLTGGCTCNYLPVSQAFVPRAVIERLAGRQKKP